MQDIQYSNYLLAGLAAVGAGVFTNPLEVIKTRLQLQGELAKQGKNAKIYRGVLHAFYQVGTHDGIRGLQKGLVPALGFQVVVNSIRLGMFDTASTLGWTRTSQGRSSISLCFFWGALGGTIGGCVASPFFLVKTQMQSFSSPDIAVGFQRKHEGMMHAFRKIYSKRGVRGLYRGAIGNIPRAIVGSGIQLATFEPTKEFLRHHDMCFKSATANSFLCALISGTTLTVAITPPDMILTRLYNQQLDGAGKGKLYSGFVDCFWKVCKSEGYLGLYKGFWPNYLRLAPHSTLLLLFYDEAKALRNKYYG